MPKKPPACAKVSNHKRALVAKHAKEAQSNFREEASRTFAFPARFMVIKRFGNRNYLTNKKHPDATELVPTGEQAQVQLRQGVMALCCLAYNKPRGAGSLATQHGTANRWCKGVSRQPREAL